MNVCTYVGTFVSNYIHQRIDTIFQYLEEDLLLVRIYILGMISLFQSHF